MGSFRENLNQKRVKSGDSKIIRWGVMLKFFVDFKPITKLCAPQSDQSHIRMLDNSFHQYIIHHWILNTVNLYKNAIIWILLVRGESRTL